jgi:hypothetical protein
VFVILLLLLLILLLLLLLLLYASPPQGLCAAPDGTINVADKRTRRIRRILPSGQVTRLVLLTFCWRCVYLLRPLLARRRVSSLASPHLHLLTRISSRASPQVVTVAGDGSTIANGGAFDKPQDVCIGEAM